MGLVVIHYMPLDYHHHQEQSVTQRCEILSYGKLPNPTLWLYVCWNTTRKKKKKKKKNATQICITFVSLPCDSE